MQDNDAVFLTKRSDGHIEVHTPGSKYSPAVFGEKMLWRRIDGREMTYGDRFDDQEKVKKNAGQ
jgi:hypothetical protein